MQNHKLVEMRGLDAGILMAIQAVLYAATKTPGFNMEALRQAATYLKANTGGVPDNERQAFEMPLNQLLGDTSAMHAEIEKHASR